MPKRIYALAKELTMDSKDLVDLCTKLGILNKGSALASLDDAEVERINQHLTQAEAKAPSSEPAQKPKPLTPQRPSDLPLSARIGADTGKVRVLDAPTRSGSQVESPDSEEAAPEEVAAEAVAEPVASPSPEAEPVAEQAPAETAKAPTEAPTQPAAPPPAQAAPPADTKPAAPAAATPPAPAVAKTKATPPPPAPAPEAPQRSYRGPLAGSGGRIRSLDARGSGDKPSSQRKPAQRREPVINLAKLPKGAKPHVPPPKSNEPAPQRPEIRFTKDDISGQKQGMKAPLAELEEKQATRDSTSRGTGSKSRGSATGVGNQGATTGKGGLSGFNADRAKGKGRKEDDDDSPRKRASGVAAARTERKRRGRGPNDRDDDRRPHRGSRFQRKGTTNTAAPRKENVALELPCTVRSFSEAAGVPAGRVLGTLMQMGHGLTINANMDAELAELLAASLEVEIEFKQPPTLEEHLIDSIENFVDPPEDLVTRPPVVTFLGHVDHGKTSLLDYLIGINVVTGEAGGITQHIRAYQVAKDDRLISFVDTPGHEAFTEMRARGANVTDIAVLVIAADDGIMPQTEEAISHAKAAGVPIVVALNKIDLPGVDETRTLTQMTEHGLTPSEWGGDVEVVRTSAISGQGMDELLETLLTVAELHDYKANPNRPAVGVCLESGQQSDRGVVAKIVVQQGTLNVGDVVLCGTSYGRVKALYDTLNPSVTITSAGPTVPVNITGLDEAPAAGDRFYVLGDIADARALAETRGDQSRAESLAGTSPKVSFDTFQELLQSGKLGVAEDRVELNLIIRADARGSLEAIEKELSKLEHPEVGIRILQKSVGGISVADVTLASASDAVVVGFNVIPDDNARAMADARKVEIRRYSIIYKLAEEIKSIIEGRLRPEERIIELGRALVKTVFTITRVGAVAGCYVAQGSIERGCRIRVNRDSRTIGDYQLDSLKRHKDDVKEVPRGMECGIKLVGFNDLKQDDVLEAYRIEEVARTLD